MSGGWDMGEPRKPAPREPWNRERDDAAYREAVEHARPAPDGPDTILADMEQDIEAAIVRARARLRLVAD
jgi:hypothetical protein